ncbi:MAG: DUF2271 domain-containing protein [Bacteroidaceae bacterium]|nr:DUF2271 domain-containing protein [Bacteroidaceae bacterium]
MKKIITMCLLIASSLWILAMNGGQPEKKFSKDKCVEITFDYNRKSGPGSNQYAVWVENEKNEVVKTLFVTSFTTKGRVREGQPIKRGYTYRPTCVPTWVEHAKASEISDIELDAFTGATPKESGKQTFMWDFTDNKGKRVAKGTYKVLVEATLKNECRILFTGTINPEATVGEIPMTATETGSNEEYAGMVKSVKVIVK